MDTISLLKAAVDNNVAWCSTMCNSHGMSTTMTAECWINYQDTLPFYPNLISLLPTTYFDSYIAKLDSIFGSYSVKDSYATQDLSRKGFELLFKASWIELSKPVVNTQLEVHVLRDKEQLTSWEYAWNDNKEPKYRLFSDSLMTDEIQFIAVYEGKKIVAGGIANRTSNVVGFSNVFYDTIEQLYAIIHTIRQAFPHLPIVGYEHGKALEEIKEVGCKEIGPLCVWSKKMPL